MHTKNFSWGWVLGIAIASADICSHIFTSNCAFAQITPDTSLPNPTQVNTVGNTTNITGGTQAGTNLFHSFQEFSVLKGNTAFFNNTADIQNIISRVTGGSRSEIDGLIKANGTANLFLINPNGIVFGQNARLDIGGSFIASTANSIKFANGTEFRANPNSSTSPLLTISVPLGLQFGIDPKSISYQSNISDPINANKPGLEVREGKTLALVGGNVLLDGAILKAPAGRVEIVGVGSNSSVNLNQTATGWKVDSSPSTTFADIQITNKSQIDTTGVRNGGIAIRGKDISLTSVSSLQAGTIGNQNGEGISIVGDSIQINQSNLVSYTLGAGNGGSILFDAKSIKFENSAVVTQTISPTLGAGKAGDITFKADSVVINQSGVISNSSGAGSGGHININANTLQIKQSGVNANVFAAGNSGDITIKAGELIINTGGIGSTVLSGGTGNAGKVNITADSLKLTNAGINSDTQENSTGNAGEIIFNIANQMTVGYAGINAKSQGTGNGGKISINANELQIEYAGVGTNTRNTDKSGEIGINVTGNFNLSYASIDNTSDGTGNGGLISIKANSLNIQQGGINTTTNSTGNAGDININLNDKFSLEGGAVYTGSYDSGNGGRINISADNFHIASAEGIISQTQSAGTGGDINIQVKDLFDIQKTAIYTSSSGAGNGGSINISARNFKTASAGIISQTEGAGIGGDINFNVKELFNIQNGGGVTVLSFGTGRSGRINISTGNFQIENGEIISKTESLDKGGDIQIGVKDSFILRKGTVYATSSGRGGSSGIDIVVGGNLQIANSGIITETQGTGKGGDIKIDVKELSLEEPGINPDSLSTRVMANSIKNGNAGNIKLFADKIELNGIVAISSNVGSTAAPIVTIDNQQKIPEITVTPRGNTNTIYPDAVGNSGNITINAKSVSVLNGAQLTTSNFGRGNAGNITITTGEAIFDGKNSTNTSGVSSSIAKDAVGNGGTIEITTNNLTLKNGAQLTTSNLNQGNAGKIIIKAANRFFIDGVSGQDSKTGVFAESQTGKGGDIQLTADLLLLRRGAVISNISKVEGAGGFDGNIDINTKFLVAVPKENSDIIAIGSGRSPGSNIQVFSQGIFGTQIRKGQTLESDIVATGQVTLNIPDTNPNNGLVNFPINFVDASRLINQNFCAVRSNNSSFKVTGRGGLPLSPDEPLRGRAMITNWVTLAEGNEQTGDIKEGVTKQSTPQAIVEAQGWVINEQGEVTLVASVPTATPYEPWKTPSGCQPNS